MVERQPVPIIGGRTRACGGIGRRARLRALWGVSPVGVRVSLGALVLRGSRPRWRNQGGRLHTAVLSLGVSRVRRADRPCLLPACVPWATLVIAILCSPPCT